MAHGRLRLGKRSLSFAHAEPGLGFLLTSFARWLFILSSSNLTLAQVYTNAGFASPKVQLASVVVEPNDGLWASVRTTTLASVAPPSPPSRARQTNILCSVRRHENLLGSTLPTPGGFPDNQRDKTWSLLANAPRSKQQPKLSPYCGNACFCAAARCCRRRLHQQQAVWMGAIQRLRRMKHKKKCHGALSWHSTL